MAEESRTTELSSGSASFYGWKYSHYFAVVEESEKTLRARCTLCPATKKPLSTAHNTTSNLKKHLESVHKTITLEAKDHGDESRKRKRESDDVGEPSQQKKQRLLLNRSLPSPTTVRRLISEYVVEDVLPLSTVESPAFRKLISGISSAQVPDRKSFTQHLDKAYDEMERKVKESLENIDSASTTADVWTAHNRSYFGMTVHWIDPVSLNRCKAAICCTRIVGRHTYDVLAAKIEHVHRAYGLNGKVTATVTDNGSNFVKAFSNFSSPVVDSSSVSSLPSSDIQDDENDLNEEETAFESISDTLTIDLEQEDRDLTQLEYELPAHERCASHTLNLVASSDVDKCLSSSSITRSVYRSSFAKCCALWNKASRSSQAADKVEEVLKRKLTVTRWNSYFNTVERITENSVMDLNELCTRLDLRCFSEKEISFLKEYHKVLKPLARGLDILQGEDNCFYGTLLPTLETILKKVRAMKSEISSTALVLAICIENSIQQRFSRVFESRDAILSAISHPKFKLKWVEGQVKKDRYKQIFIDEMRKYEDEMSIVEDRTPEPDVASQKKDFYEFESDTEESSIDSVELEVAEYFSVAKKIECLHKFPTVKRIFLKYNTTIPSSAPVERLFSLGSLVLIPRRSGLTPSRFERLLLLRYNKSYVDF